MNKPFNKPSKGFSIVEALIVVAILSVVLSAIFGIAYRAQVSFDAEKQFTETSQHARLAMDEIVRYIRQAGNDPFPKDSFSYLSVERVGANEINVYSDITGSYAGGQTGDPDGKLDSLMENMNIRYDPGSKAIYITDLKAPAADPGQRMLADNVELPPGESFFRFYDSAGAETADSTKIVSVQVSMAAKTPARAGSGQNTVVYRSHVFIRSKSFDVFATP